MALEYTLSIDTQLAPEEVLSRMFAGQRPTATTLRGNHLWSIERAEFLVLSHRVAKGDSVLKDELGVDPAVSVLFRLDKFRDLNQAKQHILTAMLTLVRDLTSDFALLFNGEIVILLRRSGALVMNERAAFWEGGLDAALDLPHARHAFEPL